ncbi:conserved hypothetical protein, partial [Streptomyces sp. e14]
MTADRLARAAAASSAVLRRRDGPRPSRLAVPPPQPSWTGRCIESDLMPKPDELIVDIAALVESGQSNQMSLTVVAKGAVITGRLAPEAVWRQRVSEVLADSADLGEFSAVFDTAAKKDG